MCLRGRPAGVAREAETDMKVLRLESWQSAAGAVDGRAVVVPHEEYRS